MKQSGKFYKKEDINGQDYIVICIEDESEGRFWGVVIKCDPRHECQAARFSADDFEECENPYLSEKSK